MNERSAAIATTAFAFAAPGMVAGVLPWSLRGEPSTAFPGGWPSRAVAAGLITGGSAIVADSFVRFVRARGTPAPIAETEDLVRSGLYRYTRNPQYVGVLAVIAGQALAWRSPRIATYGAVMATCFHLTVRLYEEPRLRRRFGAAYERFAAEVPRWPRPFRR